MEKQKNKHVISTDDDILSAIKRITSARETYGYRRVTTLLNHERKQAKNTRINHKKVYRIMKENNLLLPIHGKNRRVLMMEKSLP